MRIPAVPHQHFKFLKDKDPEQLTKVERDSIYLHLINKITAIGYLLNDFRNPSEEKVIVAMDGKMSEVGKSNGRSGKSLLGRALEQISEQTYIDGKKFTNPNKYIFSDMTPHTRHIFLDDVKQDFSFNRLLSAISGPLLVKKKMRRGFKIPYEKVPKIYLTTNYTIEDDSNLTQDFLVPIIFSDWYHIEHKPIDEFKHTFFYGWDELQWQLFDNLMAECTMIYLRSRQLGWSKPECGLIMPPADGEERRQLRQKMGEAFLNWAEMFFSKDSGNLNRKINSSKLYEAFYIDNPRQKLFVTKTKFREKLETFCKYSGLHYNPHKMHKEKKIPFSTWIRRDPTQSFIGERDSSGGIVWMSVCTREFANNSCKLLKNQRYKYASRL